MYGLVICVGPTRRYTVALAISFDGLRRRSRSNLRPARLDAAQTSALAAMIAALPPKDAR